MAQIVMGLLLWPACIAVAPRAADAQHAPAAATAAPAVARTLARVKDTIMTADYRADLEQLARSRVALDAWRDDPRWGYLACYWAGYASWRQAMNGVSRRMGKDEQRALLAAAVADFEGSLQRRADFADALAAASSVHSWFATFLDDAALAREHYQRSALLLRQALQAAPDNPRVLWVQGGFYLFKPLAYGGDPPRAERIYREQARLAARPDASSPLPDWGRAEAWMSLAYAHLTHAQPDAAAARREARTALRLRPDWWYVRAVLLPQIEQASHGAN